MKIYLIRHGKDDDNYRGGWSSLGLTQEGKKQAEALALFLKEYKKEYPISKIISSDLKRTLEMANAIGKELNLPIISSPDWREINNGDLAGMLNSAALKKYPDLFFSSLRMDEYYPNGESPIDFFTRIKKAFNTLLKEDLSENVAVITHTGVINIIYHIIKGVEWSNKSKTFPISNASIHVLQYENNKIKLVEENKVIR